MPEPPHLLWNSCLCESISNEQESTPSEKNPLCLVKPFCYHAVSVKSLVGGQQFLCSLIGVKPYLCVQYVYLFEAELSVLERSIVKGACRHVDVRTCCELLRRWQSWAVRACWRGDPKVAEVQNSLWMSTWARPPVLWMICVQTTYEQVHHLPLRRAVTKCHRCIPIFVFIQLFVCLFIHLYIFLFMNSVYIPSLAAFDSR